MSRREPEKRVSPVQVSASANMVEIPSGRFRMGSEDFYPEERPVRTVDGREFWIDVYPVTAAEYRRFVRETKYVTVAERPLDPADYPPPTPTCSGQIARPPEDRWAGPPRRQPQLVGVRPGRVVEAARRPGHDDQRA